MPAPKADFPSPSSWKAHGEQFDDRVVECNVNPITHGWRFMRFRDDKEHGNHRSIVEKIIASIRDGVQLDEVCGNDTRLQVGRI
jgi:mRNA guanylyltransferase